MKKIALLMVLLSMTLIITVSFISVIGATPPNNMVYVMNINPENDDVKKFLPDIRVPHEIETAQLWRTQFKKVNDWDNLKYSVMWINYSGWKHKTEYVYNNEPQWNSTNGNYTYPNEYLPQTIQKNISTYWVNTKRVIINWKGNIFVDKDADVKCNAYPQFVYCDSKFGGNADGVYNINEAHCLFTKDEVRCTGGLGKKIKKKMGI